MLEEFDAVYRDGVFVPEIPCDLADNTKVHLILGNVQIAPPAMMNPAERKRIVEETIARMQANPISGEPHVYPPNVTPPTVTDPAERKKILEKLFRMMAENPIPADAPKLTREEMHERR
jgi:hypothetical protein